MFENHLDELHKFDNEITSTKLNDKHTLFDNEIMNGTVEFDESSKKYIINGTIKNIPSGKINYLAACNNNKGYSLSSINMPFPNPEIAYENTENKGSVYITNNKFNITINSPSAYYIGQGTVLVKPHIHINIDHPIYNKTYTIVLSDNTETVSLKNLTNRPNRTVRR